MNNATIQMAAIRSSVRFFVKIFLYRFRFLTHKYRLKAVKAMRYMDTWERTAIAKAWYLHNPSLKRLLLLMTASTVRGMTVEAVNMSVKARATISMVVGV